MEVILIITDLLTFLVSLVGIILSIVYILSRLCSTEEQRVDENLRGTISGLLARSAYRDHTFDLIINDYKISGNEIGRRDNIILLVGTILIGASLLLIGNLTQRESSFPIAFYAFSSIGFYCVWLWGIHETARKLNNITYRRLRAIEEALSNHYDHEGEGHEHYRFGIHSYIHAETHNQTSFWLRLRRVFWGVVLLFLSIVWMLFSVSLRFSF